MYNSAHELFEDSNLNFEVVKRPAHIYLDGGQRVRVPDQVAVGRADQEWDDRWPGYFSMAGKDAPLLQNSEVATLIDELGLDLGGATAGVLRNGQMGWAKFNLPAHLEVVPSDEVRGRFTLFWGHGGKAALNAGVEFWRLICANGMMAWETDSLFKIKHTKNMARRISATYDAWSNSVESFRKYGELARWLASQPMTDDQWDVFVKKIVPSTTDKVPTRTQNLRDTLTQNFHYGIGQNLPGVAKTKWAAVNAVSQYTTHDIGIRVSNGRRAMGESESSMRIESNLMGAGAKLGHQAVRLLQAA
jgi:phage/plasmid-like protein (TIGR03299 family)